MAWSPHQWRQISTGWWLWNPSGHKNLFFLGKPPAFSPLGYYNKINGWLINNRNLCLKVLETGKCRSRHWQIQNLVRAHFLKGCLCCNLTWWKGWGISEVSFIKALISFMRGPLWWCNHPKPHPIILVVRISTYEFWGHKHSLYYATHFHLL